MDEYSSIEQGLRAYSDGHATMFVCECVFWLMLRVCVCVCVHVHACVHLYVCTSVHLCRACLCGVRGGRYISTIKFPLHKIS